MLRSAVRRLSAIPNPYERPARRIAAEASKSLDRTLSLVRRCRRSSVLCRMVSITTGSADFCKALALLEAFLVDLRWLLSVYSDDPSDGGGASGLVLFLPPIASTDPILSWVWSCIAAVQMAARPSDRVEAATSLANLALDSGRNKKIIIEDGGVPPLLALLRDGAASMDAQIAAATALSNLAADRELVSLIISDLAVPVVVQVLNDAPMQLQALVGCAGLGSQAEIFKPVTAPFTKPCLARSGTVAIGSFQAQLGSCRAGPGRPSRAGLGRAICGPAQCPTLPIASFVLISPTATISSFKWLCFPALIKNSV